MANFRPIDRGTGFLLPPSVDEWLPAEHLARFIAEIVETLDLRAITGSYRGKGSAPYHPCMLLTLILMAMPRASSRAADWSVRPMTRWRSASSPSINTPTRYDRLLSPTFFEGDRDTVRGCAEGRPRDGNAETGYGLS